MKKRTRLIIVLASVLALILLALLWFLLGSGRWKNGGKDTPYPYSYQLQRDGSVCIRIKEDTTGGFSWKFEEEQMNYLKHSEPQVVQGNTEFTITPLRVGLADFTLQHRRESAMVDCDYAFDFMIRVSENLKIDLVSATGRIMEPMREQSSPSGFKFHSSASQPMELSLQFSAPENQLYDWQLEIYDEAVVTIVSKKTEEGGFNLRIINSIGKGASDLRVVARPLDADGEIVSDRPGVLYTGRLTIGERGEIILSDETFEEFTGFQLSATQLTQLTEARQWIDRPLVVPEGGMMTLFSHTKTMSLIPIAEMEFTMKKESWRLLATTKENAAKLLNDISSDGKKSAGQEEAVRKENVTLKTGVMQLIETGNESYAFWQDAGGVAWCLTGEQGGAKELQTMAEAVWQANK